MGQRRRFDGPGQVHHVMNRGVGKRLLFQDRHDYRRFIFLMACAVRRREIEIIAFCLMPNHFHLVVSSQRGTLSKAMQRIQNDYSRWFNRRHRRDGPLFRGRFRSRPVNSTAYFGTLVAYVDANPVTAGLCARAHHYPWGSARFYASEDSPPWLSVRVIHHHLSGYRGTQETLGECYLRMFGTPSEAAVEVVEAELTSRRQSERHLDALLRATPERVRAWMIAKARNADGLRPWAVVAAPSAVEAAYASIAPRLDFKVQLTRKAALPGPFLLTGCLHLLAGQAQPEIAVRLGVTQGTISKRVRAHRTLIQTSEQYATAAAALCSLAIEGTFANRDTFCRPR